jgi:hypothetical protein
MGNLCSIFHSKFIKLVGVIKSPRKAQLVDYIFLGWQNSAYRLRGSNNKWFMQPYDQIIAATGIARSSLERYIKELVEDGYLIRRQALYSRTTDNNDFVVKKGAYLCVSDKLLNLLHPSSQSVSDNASHDVPVKSEASNTIKIQPEDNAVSKNCINIVINEGTGSLNLRGSYIRDLYSSYPINNIIDENSKRVVDTRGASQATVHFEQIKALVLSEIQEEIPGEIKTLVLGTFNNLLCNNHLQISNPKQVVAEYLFALLNTTFYMPTVLCFRHRNNILAKLLKQKSWKTPIGFYKHFYLGQSFKAKQSAREHLWENKKEQEIRNGWDFCEDRQDPRLQQIDKQIFLQSALLEGLNAQILKEPDGAVLLALRDQIKHAKQQLHALWAEQRNIEIMVEEEGRGGQDLCA